MDLFKYFRKAQPTAPEPKGRWIGSVEGVWSNKSLVHYNLFVLEDGTRRVEAHGYEWSKHTVYLTKIYPWAVGGPDEVIYTSLATKDEAYWATIKTKFDAIPEPVKRGRKKV